MPFYQHYSFDLWLTLIKSNPHFKKERALFFHKHLNTKHKSIEEVEKTFRQVDLMSNATNEKTGQNISANELYLPRFFVGGVAHQIYFPKRFFHFLNAFVLGVEVLDRKSVV